MVGIAGVALWTAACFGAAYWCERFLVARLEQREIARGERQAGDDGIPTDDWPIGGILLFLTSWMLLVGLRGG